MCACHGSIPGFLHRRYVFRGWFHRLHLRGSDLAGVVAALYCVCAGLFCVFFTLVFGPNVGNAWITAWAIAMASGIFVIQPLTVLVKAVVTHTAVWSFANITSLQGEDAATFAMGALSTFGVGGGGGGGGGLGL